MDIKDSSRQLPAPRNRRPSWTKLQAAALPGILQRLAVGEALGTIASDHGVSMYAIRAVLYGRNWNPGEEELKRIRAERRNALRAQRTAPGQKAHRTVRRGGHLPQDEVGGKKGKGNQDSVQGHDDLNSTFGRWLEQTRFEREMDLAAFAGQTGVSTATISRLERGEAQVTLMTALHLCDGLQVPLAALGKICLERIAPELEDIGNREIRHILTLHDLLAYRDYCRRDWRSGSLLLVDVLHRSASTDPTVTDRTGQAVQVMPLHFGPGDVEKLLAQVSSAPSAVLDLPHLVPTALWNLAAAGGVVTFPDVGAYLKHLRLMDDLTLQSLQQAVAIPFTVLGRLEQGVIERVKLATVIALDRQWRQEGRVLALFWSATHYAHVISASTEGERKLLACFVRACRRVQQDSLVDLLETLRGT
jgi:transcriptional regulator with XRE-family HTH domain